MQAMHSILIETWQLLLLVLAPLTGALIAGLAGSKFLYLLSSKTLIHRIVIFGVLISCVVSFYTAYQVFYLGASYHQTIYTWMDLGAFKFEIGFLIDKLSAMMLCVVTFVSLMVHIYTISYMKDDESYARFFSYISLFTFAMLMLVMSNNLLQLFFGWEAVGVASYLLIGFWFKKPTAIYANLKAFLVNRFGDLGFALGIALIAIHLSTLNYAEIFANKDALLGQNLLGSDWSLITVICVCLFIGAMGKSAQFPLHVWLPDSMEGPTPISALIHAATMVTAGIFMVARFSPLFELSDTALSYIIITGSITALFMGFLGIVQNDIKRVVAYSTLSQLGYMTVALGVSAYPIAAFHLFTHAFFKALLFLGAGSVIMGCHHNQDMRYMGNIKKYMPITHWCSLLGSIALIGFPFTSGFYSKDLIIEAVHKSNLWGAQVAYYSLLAGVFVTAFYSFRMYFLVFHGEERYHLNPDAHHGEHTHHGHDDKPHESPWQVCLALLLLAIPSIAVGYLTMPYFLNSWLDKGVIYATTIAIDTTKHGAMQFLTEEMNDAWHLALHGFTTLPFILAMSGVLLACLLYLVKPEVPSMIKRAFLPIHRLLEEKYYLDKLNELVFIKGGMFTAYALWRYIDQALIDKYLVGGLVKVSQTGAKIFRVMHTGFLYHSVMMMVVGIMAILLFVMIKI